METLGHVSNLYLNRPALELADRLLGLAGIDGKVFFGNSGAEANEAALKLARRLRPGGGFVAAEGGFHGRTAGALSVTGQPGKREPFEPLVPGVSFVPYGDATLPPGTAALILEPIQGEVGVVPAPPGYLAAAREACDAAGAVLVLDEVQTGIGRTGEWFAFQHAGVAPDVVTVAKGLAGGLPIGACLAFGAAADAFRPGDHGSTFGGNPVVCAAALAVLDVIEEEGLLDRAAKLGDRLTGGLSALAGVAAVRGQGLLLGVVLEQPVAKAVEAALREAGFLVNAIGDSVIRLAPPLVVTEGDVDALIPAMATALAR
jgi:acetylornithine aminotransferase